jgi:4-amino-4-deoxy-L-arabinose transferase-like glycosyltransferase
MLLPYICLRICKKTDPNNTIAEISGGWRWLAGPVVMLAAISLWFLPMLLLVENSQNPLYEIYRDNILFKQTVTRYANSWHHFKPFWYYLVSVIPLFWLPLSLMLPWLLKHWKLAINIGDRRIILPLVWVLLVIVFFSLSPGKRGVYILPALPMLALIAAPYLLQIIHHKWFSRIVWLVVLIVSLAALVLGLSGLMELDFATKLSLKQPIEPWGFFITLGLSGCAICLFTYTRYPFVSWIIFIPLLWVVYSTWGYRLMNPVRAPHNVFAAIEQVISPKSDIALIGLKEQFLLFSPYSTTHFGYHTANEEQAKAAWLWLQRADNRFVLVNKDIPIPCFDLNFAIPVGFAHRVNWALLSTDSLMPSCDKPESPINEYHYQPVIESRPGK